MAKPLRTQPYLARLKFSFGLAFSYPQLCSEMLILSAASIRITEQARVGA